MIALIYLLLLFTLTIATAMRSAFSLADNRFKMEFLYRLLLYILEIWTIFLLFQWILSSHKSTLGYSEEGTLKIFIDFFTVYQIFIFVVLKLYDSLKIDTYSSLLFLLNIMIPHVESREPIPEGFEDEDTFKDVHKLIIPRDADNMRTNIFDLIKDYRKTLEEYEKLLDDDQSDRSEVESRFFSIKHQLYVTKSTLELSKEELNFHWKVSLIQRIVK